MKRAAGWLALPVLLAALAGPAGAEPAAGRSRVVVWSGEPVVIRLAPGRTTAVTLPAPITSVVTTASKDAVSIETAGPRLYLAPLVPDWSGELFVVLADDTQVALLARPAEDEPDLLVRLARAPDPARRPEAEPLRRWSPLRLMRAMMLGEQLEGLTVSREPDLPVVYDDTVLRLRAVERWRAPALEGVVLEAENQTGLWVRVALESLQFPGLLAVSADSETLAPRPETPEGRLAARHTTRLYLIRLPEGRAR